jgi:ribosomal protein S18 acetylase RimI-like enzyme
MIDALAIVPLSSHHASTAARLHILGQPGTFLTSLGPAVLTVFYEVLPLSSTGFGFAAISLPTPQPGGTQDIGTVLGFVSATTGVGRLFLELGTQRLPEFLPPLVARFVRQPALAWRSLQTLAYPLLVRQDDPATPTAELLSIMVEPRARSLGIGALLLQALFHECRQQQIPQLDVTVDAANRGAQRFYERHGFVRVRAFTLYGRQMLLYVRRME